MATAAGGPGGRAQLEARLETLQEEARLYVHAKQTERGGGREGGRE